MKKITRATIKSFIKANKDNLFIRCERTFDGMIDGEREIENLTFKKVDYLPEGLNRSYDNNLGVIGAWFVGDSRDSYREFNEGDLIGYYIYNCCGSFTIATLKK